MYPVLHARTANDVHHWGGIDGDIEPIRLPHGRTLTRAAHADDRDRHHAGAAWREAIAEGDEWAGIDSKGNPTW